MGMNISSDLDLASPAVNKFTKAALDGAGERRVLLDREKFERV
jgi:hypothetical protein